MSLHSVNTLSPLGGSSPLRFPSVGLGPISWERFDRLARLCLEPIFSGCGVDPLQANKARRLEIYELLTRGTCPNCSGEGLDYEDLPCEHCEGKGRIA